MQKGTLVYVKNSNFDYNVIIDSFDDSGFNGRFKSKSMKDFSEECGRFRWSDTTEIKVVQ